MHSLAALRDLSNIDNREYKHDATLLAIPTCRTGNSRSAT